MTPIRHYYAPIRTALRRAFRHLENLCPDEPNSGHSLKRSTTITNELKDQLIRQLESEDDQP